MLGWNMVGNFVDNVNQGKSAEDVVKAGWEDYKGAWTDGLSTIPIIGPMVAGDDAAKKLAQKEKEYQDKANAINPIRPTATTPAEVSQNQAMYRNLATSNQLPGQAQMQNQAGQVMAQGVAQAQNVSRSPSEMLAAITGMNNNYLGSINQMNMQGAQNRMGAIQGLSNANMVSADYQDRNFDYNMNQPYMMDIYRKMALEGAAKNAWQSGLETKYNSRNQASNQAMDVGKTALSAGMYACDFRLKRSIKKIDVVENIPIYEYKYTDYAQKMYGYSNGVQVGLIAQDLIKDNSEALIEKDGYYFIDTSKLPVNVANKISIN